jgi:glycogen synthase
MTTPKREHENRKIRLLVWAPFFWPDVGGIEIITAKLVAQLCERAVITAHGREELPDAMDFEGVPVYRFSLRDPLLKRNIPLLLRTQRQINRIAADFRPDMHYLNFGGPVPISFFYLRAADAAPAPVVVSLHNSIAGLDAGKDTVLGRIFAQAARVTACSAAVLADARRVAPGIRGRSSVVYYGLDAPEPEPRLLDFEAPRILCLGRAVEEKGFDTALSAFNMFRPRYPEARLLVAGGGASLPALKAQAADLGLDGSVDFRGEIAPDSVHALINTACMVLVPSRWREAFGLVALEAAQMGRPVVATQAGGLPEVVRDGETGLVVPKDDARALCAAMTRLMEYPDRARAMGRAAHSRAIEDFSGTAYADAFDTLFRGLCGNSGNTGPRERREDPL